MNADVQQILLIVAFLLLALAFALACKWLGDR